MTEVISCKRAFVVQSHEGLRKQWKELLEGQGYEVTTYTSGKKALDDFRDALRSGPPVNLVVTDGKSVEDLNGMLLIKQLRAAEAEASTASPATAIYCSVSINPGATAEKMLRGIAFDMGATACCGIDQLPDTLKALASGKALPPVDDTTPSSKRSPF